MADFSMSTICFLEFLDWLSPLGIKIKHRSTIYKLSIFPIVTLGICTYPVMPYGSTGSTWGNVPEVQNSLEVVTIVPLKGTEFTFKCTHHHARGSQPNGQLRVSEFRNFANETHDVWLINQPPPINKGLIKAFFHNYFSVLGWWEPPRWSQWFKHKTTITDHHVVLAKFLYFTNLGFPWNKGSHFPD